VPARRSEHVDKKTSRSLTLVAKTIQNLANLVVFGQKEEYMCGLNDWITRRMLDMRSFLDKTTVRVGPPGRLVRHARRR